MDRTELNIERVNTVEFIAADPVTLILQRATKTPTSAGGFKMTYAPLSESQVFRLIPTGDRIPEVRDLTGRLVAPTYTLMGFWDADMEQWDRFNLNDVWYQIVSPIRPLHTEDVYERKGDVVRSTDG